MISVPKVMIFLFVVLSTILFWTSSNVCRYNFTIEKRTNELNILAEKEMLDFIRDEIYNEFVNQILTEVNLIEV